MSHLLTRIRVWLSQLYTMMYYLWHIILTIKTWISWMHPSKYIVLIYAFHNSCHSNKVVCYTLKWCNQNWSTIHFPIAESSTEERNYVNTFQNMNSSEPLQTQTWLCMGTWRTKGKSSSNHKNLRKEALFHDELCTGCLKNVMNGLLHAKQAVRSIAAIDVESSDQFTNTSFRREPMEGRSVSKQGREVESFHTIYSSILVDCWYGCCDFCDRGEYVESDDHASRYLAATGQVDPFASPQGDLLFTFKTWSQAEAIL